MLISKNQKGATVVETLIICILVGILIVVALFYLGKTVSIARQIALRMELVNIRGAIMLYKISKKKNPKDLKALLNENYLLPTEEFTIENFEHKTIVKQKYLEVTALDEEGYPLDPFGNRYLYSNRLGRVKSQTKGYENW